MTTDADTKTIDDMLDDITLRLDLLADAAFLICCGANNGREPEANVNAGFHLQHAARAIREQVGEVHQMVLGARSTDS